MVVAVRARGGEVDIVAVVAELPFPGSIRLNLPDPCLCAQG